MIKIEIPPALRAEIAAAIASLTPPPGEVVRLKEAALTAGKAITFYHQSVPETFADHNVEFFRQRAHALEVGRQTDAFECLLGLRNHAIMLQPAPATPENTAWLMKIFDYTLSGQLHLRAAAPES
jgi:hypothetical protein